MPVNTSKNLRIGILGGGQLSQMLAEAGRKLNLDVSILSASKQDPAARIEGIHHFQGSIEDDAVLHRFLHSVDTVIFENEFVDCDRLEDATTKHESLEFMPSLDAIRTLQDKLKQKRLLEKLEVPSSPFVEISPGCDDEMLRNWITDCEKRFQGRTVYKWSRLGYDGKGVLISPKPEAAIFTFCKTALERGIEIYCEEKVPFTRELAMVVARSRYGEFLPYPLVRTEQDDGICKFVTGPAIALGNRPDQETQAQSACRLVGDYLNLHGVWAIEFFETTDGRLLVNEIAPRVHNTGHYSQDACQASQFENHMRAAAALDLESLGQLNGAFAMLNLLGPPNCDIASTALIFPDLDPNLHLHWYWKTEIRPGRKVGHVNGRVESASELSDLISRLKDYDRRWNEEVRRAHTKTKKP